MHPAAAAARKQLQRAGADGSPKGAEAAAAYPGRSREVLADGSPMEAAPTLAAAAGAGAIARQAAKRHRAAAEEAAASVQQAVASTLAAGAEAAAIAPRAVESNLAASGAEAAKTGGAEAQQPG